MNKLTQWLALASVATLCLSVGNLMAQEQPAPGGPGGDRGGRGGPGGDRGGRGNFDPAQFRQQMEERVMQSVRDRLEIKDDTEWKAIEPLVKKVNDLRMQQATGGMRGMFGRGGRGGPGGDQGGRSFFGGEPSAEQTALSDAIENSSSKDILKEKMAAFRKGRAEKEAELKTAQENLKKVLTTRQEAIALEMGLVN